VLAGRGIPIGVTVKDRSQHFAAHPYYLMGVADERERILDLIRNNEEWNNVQDVIDGLETE
jgi:hypothetical protein